MGACNSSTSTDAHTDRPDSRHREYSFHENLVRQRTNRRQSFENIYEVLDEIGRGGISTIYSIRKRPEKFGRRLGRSKSHNSGAAGKYSEFALKVIHLSMVQEDKIEQLRNEVEILKTLDHKNIIKAYETFSFKEKRTLEIVMERCTGGDLYARMPYTEATAATVMKQVFGAIAYVHSREIIHRDIKLENIMFESNHPEAEVRVIDFGLSKKYSVENPVLTERVGTLYSMSPETLQGYYTSKSDIWSIGVCLFMMLSNGDKPFEGKTPKQLVARVLKGEFQFEGPLWEDTSNHAKCFIKNLLQVDPAHRVTAYDAMYDQWFNSTAVTAKDSPISRQELVEKVQDSIVRFADTGEFRKLALNVIAKKSTVSEIFELRKVFDDFDTLNTGTITLVEFKAALVRFNYSDDEIEKIFRKVDVNRTNVINYTEFLAAALDTQGVIEEYRLLECFDQMDCDGSGFISRSNLRELLGKHSSETFIDQLMEEADLKKDGRISYQEFRQVVSKEHRKTVTKIYDDPEHKIASEEEAEETRATNEVLHSYGLLDSIRNLRTNRSKKRTLSTLSQNNK